MSFASFDGANEIESSAGLHLSKLVHFSEFKLTNEDYIFIPGIDYELLSNRQFLSKNRSFFEWLKAQNSEGVRICSVCTGTFLLAEAGILNHKSCTTHWKYISKFESKYPMIEVLQKRLFVSDDNIYTSAGVSSGLDLSLFILEQELGTKFASDVAKEVVIYFRRGESDPQLSIYLEYRNHLDNRVHQAQDFLIQNIDKNFRLIELSEHVFMSTRNLTRLFKKTTGITIGAYVEKLRVERAVQLLSENQKVEYVAQQCGLKSTNQLRTLLKKHINKLPTTMEALN